MYHVEARHRPTAPGCNDQRSRVKTAPSKGRVIRLKLPPPPVEGDPDARRWCVGAYRAWVYFKRTVRCPPSVQCGDSVAKRVGATTFTVTAEP